jgi:hypothetical protein
MKANFLMRKDLYHLVQFPRKVWGFRIELNTPTTTNHFPKNEKPRITRGALAAKKKALKFYYGFSLGNLMAT